MQPPVVHAAREISLPVSASGIFDPSIADTSSTGRSWMSYSAVDPSARWPAENTRVITTRLAFTDNHGTSWNDAGLRVNDSKDVAIGEKHGTWINEVSSLAFDPSAPEAERWQLYWHHYFSVGDKGEFGNGWIGLKTAASPQGLAQAREVKLFGARIYDQANDDPGSATQSPVGGAPVLRLDKAYPELAYCLALTEPGAMVTPAGLYLAVGCIQPRVTNVAGILGIKAFGVRGLSILLKCAAPCHPALAASWKYQGTLLTNENAKPFGALGFSAPDLYFENGRAFLLISLTSNRPVERAYNGCLLIPFDDLERGRLSRQANGRLLAIRRIQGRDNTFNGACTYQASLAAAGFVFGEIEFANRPMFHLFATEAVH